MFELIEMCNRSLTFNVIEKIMIDSWNEGNYIKSVKLLLESFDFEVSQKDETLITFLIQWLGSSEGMCFIRRTIAKLGLQVKKLSTNEMLTHHNAHIRVYGKQLYEIQHLFSYHIDDHIASAFSTDGEY